MPAVAIPLAAGATGLALLPEEAAGLALAGGFTVMTGEALAGIYLWSNVSNTISNASGVSDGPTNGRTVTGNAAAAGGGIDPDNDQDDDGVISMPRDWDVWNVGNWSNGKGFELLTETERATVVRNLLRERVWLRIALKYGEYPNERAVMEATLAKLNEIFAWFGWPYNSLSILAGLTPEVYSSSNKPGWMSGAPWEPGQGGGGSTSTTSSDNDETGLLACEGGLNCPDVVETGSVDLPGTSSTVNRLWDVAIFRF